MRANSLILSVASCVFDFIFLYQGKKNKHFNRCNEDLGTDLCAEDRNLALFNSQNT